MKLVILLLLAAGISSCSKPCDHVDNEIAIKSFGLEFGFKPPAATTNITVRQASVGDAARAWYKFKSNKETFDQIRSRGFESINYNKFLSHSVGQNAPNWWPPVNIEQLDYYGVTGWKTQPQRSYAVMTFDITTSYIYFCHDLDL
jgi:phage-related protein